MIISNFARDSFTLKLQAGISSDAYRNTCRWESGCYMYVAIGTDEIISLPLFFFIPFHLWKLESLFNSNFPAKSNKLVERRRKDAVMKEFQVFYLYCTHRQPYLLLTHPQTHFSGARVSLFFSSCLVNNRYFLPTRAKPITFINGFT